MPPWLPSDSFNDSSCLYFLCFFLCSQLLFFSLQFFSCPSSTFLGSHTLGLLFCSSSGLRPSTIRLASSSSATAWADCFLLNNQLSFFSSFLGRCYCCESPFLFLTFLHRATFSADFAMPPRLPYVSTAILLATTSSASFCAPNSSSFRSSSSATRRAPYSASPTLDLLLCSSSGIRPFNDLPGLLFFSDGPPPYNDSFGLLLLNDLFGLLFFSDRLAPCASPIRLSASQRNAHLPLRPTVSPPLQQGTWYPVRRGA